MKLKASDMRLGDIIATFDGPFNTAIVCVVKDDIVTLRRPYGLVNDVAFGSGVTFLTGIEIFSLWRSDKTEYECWRRGDVK